MYFLYLFFQFRFMFQEWWCSPSIFPLSCSTEVFFLTPKILFVLYLNFLKCFFFFKFRFHLFLPAQVVWGVYSDFPTLPSSLSLTRSLSVDCNFFTGNSLEVRSSCWRILNGLEVSHLVKSQGRQPVSSLPRHEEKNLCCPFFLLLFNLRDGKNSASIFNCFGFLAS